jgi:hypothetical protein
VAFAVIAVPSAAVRDSLRSATTLPDDLDDLVLDAVDGVLGPLHNRTKGAR